jgi:hypothetical protein
MHCATGGCSHSNNPTLGQFGKSGIGAPVRAFIRGDAPGTDARLSLESHEIGLLLPHVGNGTNTIALKWRLTCYMALLVLPDHGWLSQ